MGSAALRDAKTGLEALDPDKILAAYHDSFLFEDPPSSKSIADRAALRSYFEALFALPDVAFTDITVHEGETFAVIEWTWSGNGPSTRVPYEVRGASVLELEDGKITRETLYYDPRPVLS
jgi:ketosteroid isomerase-like protein